MAFFYFFKETVFYRYFEVINYSLVLFRVDYGIKNCGWIIYKKIEIITIQKKKLLEQFSKKVNLNIL